MRNKNKSGVAAGASSNSIHNPPPQSQLCFEGETLTRFLKSIQREIESARVVDAALPLKFWIKQQFAVGVNEVTRALERMPSNHGRTGKAPCVDLQAILLVSDCNPRWLTKHLPALADARNVPLIFLREKKEGSLRLGELVHLKTTIAIGIKDKGNAIKQVIKEVLFGNKIDSIEA
ncbi:hypothetical protein PHJA_002132900 [Phtheirospermum japonicum]|uniref:Ribosomal protein eL8/eL30/eS12/Gadd45 domain-containing protein n=1 Tax=Phtheirospermum japonicum TaxID=374723 RepID=A0A830CQP3_9LAMI|nr:hypothetical protein PHJA_002132900 [Phtheirospermum japonicum]